MTKPECPRCGLGMVMRARKSDCRSFWGCSGYPECQGTRNIAPPKDISKPLISPLEKVERARKDQGCPSCGGPMTTRIGRSGYSNSLCLSCQSLTSDEGGVMPPAEIPKTDWSSRNPPRKVKETRLSFDASKYTGPPRLGPSPALKSNQRVVAEEVLREKARARFQEFSSERYLDHPPPSIGSGRRAKIPVSVSRYSVVNDEADARIRALKQKGGA